MIKSGKSPKYSTIPSTKKKQNRNLMSDNLTTSKNSTSNQCTPTKLQQKGPRKNTPAMKPAVLSTQVTFVAAKPQNQTHLFAN